MVSRLNKKLRELPKVDSFLNDRKLLDTLNGKPRFFLLASIRKVLESKRRKIREGIDVPVDYESLKTEINNHLKKLIAPKLKRVVNATGIVIHTNLGRSPISSEVADYLREVIKGYSNLEYDLEKGKRGLRYRNLEWILKELTGAEDVCVVNNNAGAVLLILSSLSSGKEAVVSRGELIEIGGSFRIPDVMAQSGAILREVGTTNKTHLSDYERAINENTGLLMKVHTSNYKVLGFTSSVGLSELVELGKQCNVPVYNDLGSGNFIDVRKLGLSYEPTVREVVNSGVDVVSFSGDKLLGGAQAGIIVGKRNYIQRIKKHPLNRALRIDKMTLAVLEQTLYYYLDESMALKKVPIWKMLSEKPDSIKEKAKKLLGLLNLKYLKARIVEDSSEVGGGSLPLQKLPTYVVALKPIEFSTERLDYELRHLSIPIVGRLKNDEVLLDMRTVFNDEISYVAKTLNELNA